MARTATSCLALIAMMALASVASAAYDRQLLQGATAGSSVNDGGASIAAASQKTQAQITRAVTTNSPSQTQTAARQGTNNANIARPGSTAGTSSPVTPSTPAVQPITSGRHMLQETEGTAERDGGARFNVANQEAGTQILQATTTGSNPSTTKAATTSGPSTTGLASPRSQSTTSTVKPSTTGTTSTSGTSSGTGTTGTDTTGTGTGPTRTYTTGTGTTISRTTIPSRGSGWVTTYNGGPPSVLLTYGTTSAGGNNAVRVEDNTSGKPADATTIG